MVTKLHEGLKKQEDITKQLAAKLEAAEGIAKTVGAIEGAVETMTTNLESIRVRKIYIAVNISIIFKELVNFCSLNKGTHTL